MTVQNQSEEKTEYIEKEVFGVTYDRAAMTNLQRILTQQLQLKTVVETPSHGAKAAGSLYSIGFARSGCDVTLVNPEEGPLEYWDKLGLKERLHTAVTDDYTKTPFKDNQFDMAWNFVTFTMLKDKDAWLKEMMRISSKYVMLINCNNFQLGYPWHRVLHLMNNIPWNHGSTELNYPWAVQKWFRQNSLDIVESGTIDSVPWPDPVGFRDLRLHKRYGANPEGETFKKPAKWDVPMMNYLKEEKLPRWISLLKMYDIPLRKGYTKLPFSHLFYIIAKIKD